MNGIFKKAILPLALAGILLSFAWIILREYSSGWELVFKMLFLAGMPFGIRRMCLWIIPFGGNNVAASVAILALNFVAGGIIGAFVLVWKVIVAVFVIIKAIVGIFLPRKTIAEND